MRNASLGAAMLAALALSTADATAQFAERPELAGSGLPGVDCSGRSIKNPRVRAVHSDNPRHVGATAWMIETDPFLAYQLGRNLNFREFRLRDGVFSAGIASLGGPMPDGTTAKITAENQVSCSGCHNLPQGNPGGGVSFHKDSGFGRNTPHYFGAGIVEMIAIQTRQKIVEQVDTNGDGWISAREARSFRGNVRVRTKPNGRAVDYGSPRLSNGRTGTPSLNNIFRVWYVDAQGRMVSGATEVDGRTTVGYNFDMIVWGWGQGPGRAALNPTNRAFLWDPWKAHGGLEAHDPSTTNDPDGDGISEPTLSGATQFPATHQAPDAGVDLDRLGFSRDDPDGDGVLTEISEGDLDLGEWFMLNAPRPAFDGPAAEYQRGVAALHSLGCTSCHIPDWKIEAAADGYAGDRRLFDLDVRWNPRKDRIQGRLVKLYDERAGRAVRRLEAFVVRGIFSDLKHHDMGEKFAELDFGGNRNTIWRTPPLWGVGSGFPWGHDGQSLSLEDAVLRHGGEGAASRRAWQRAPRALRRIALDFMRSLVLYDIESLPADIDGDNRIMSNYRVAGRNTGPERFNAEWLFQNPVRIQGMVRNSDGVRVRSFAATNLSDAYGLNLPFRRDSDLDGWPNVWDHAPRTPGYRDGVH